MINILYVGSTSACLEWDNRSPVFRDPYTVKLNGEELFSHDRNVFSLFSLKPDSEYSVEAGGEVVSLRTKSESACLNVRDFGAAGNGEKCTTEIQTAINCLPRGGRLFFPAGVYLTAPICLRSDITIELDEGATILGSADEDDYPIIPGELNDMVTGEAVQIGSWEGEPVTMHQSLIFGEHIKNVAIVGKGTIDGNGRNGPWWINPRERKTGRPRLVFLGDCDDVTLHGISAKNSAAWQMHPYFSRNVSFLDMSVSAPKDSPNTDAIDPESCDGVRIIGCTLSVGDDCIAIKSGKIYMGRKYKASASHHTIRNCLMQFGHGAVTLGSEMAAGVKNLTVNRCIFNSTDRGLRIKTRRGRGKDAVIDGILFENIKMNNVLTPFVINMWYNCCDPDRESEYNTTRERLPIDERTPRLGKFCFRDMVCENCHVAACYCDGLPEMPIGEITVENIKFTYAKDATEGFPAMMNNAKLMCRAGMYFDNVDRLNIRGVAIDGYDGEEIIMHNVAQYNSNDYEKIEKYVRSLIEKSTPDAPLWNIESIRAGKKPHWNYVDGCMLTALLELGEITGERKYFDFVESFVDAYVYGNGSIRGYERDKFNLDDVNEGRVLFELYERTGKEKYKKAIELQKSQLDEQPRTYTGNYWHKTIYPNQVWLDGLYMAQVFCAKWQKNMGEGDYSDIFAQIKNVRAHMFDEEKRLYYHGWDASRTAFWCNKDSGLSANFWLRAIGWFMVAMADVIGICPSDADAAGVTDIFREAIDGVAAYIDIGTDMLWQVVDQAGREGNYPETSGSSMIAYAMLKGARLGVLDEEYSKLGERIFRGICRRYLTSDGDGIKLGGICLVAGLGPEDNRRRDGSYEYYISEPVVENDAKGVAPFILCYTEIKRLN